MKKEKDYIKLCFKYNQNCKRCPRNNKCLKELEKEDQRKNKSVCR
ncbi:MAG: hypothetical protein V8Q75_06415 [Bacilli bacterium]